jgi:hypothetical protein
VRHGGSPQRPDWLGNFISTNSIDKLEFFVARASFSYGAAFAISPIRQGMNIAAAPHIALRICGVLASLQPKR